MDEALAAIGGLRAETADATTAAIARMHEIGDAIRASAGGKITELLSLNAASRRRGWARAAPSQRAAARTLARTGSIRTAETLYSGVPISESPTSWVSQFTLASAKWRAIQTSPG